MSHYGKENVEELRAAANLLIELINKVGVKSTSEHFVGKVILKNCLIDLSKKINASLNGFSLLLKHFEDSNNYLMKIPLSLCVRGALSDCLTGIYLYSLSEDEKSLKNEMSVISLDYAKYLRDSEEYALRYMEELEESMIKRRLLEWEKDFMVSHPQLFKSNKNNEWTFKDSNEFRSDSKYKPIGRGTDRDKFNWIKNIDQNKDYISLYILFRYFSQYQHYNFANRDFIEKNPNEDFKKFLAAVFAIASSFRAFCFGLDQLTEEVEKAFSLIFGRLASLADRDN